MRCLKWILTSLPVSALLTFSMAKAALPHVPMATAFYRHPESLFSSGRANRNNLEKNLIRTEQEMSFALKWDGKPFTAKATDLLRDLQCLSTASLKENSLLLNEARGDGTRTGELATGATVEILRTQGNWARVRSGNKAEGWMPLQRLEARSEDLGVFIPLVDTFLREKPSQGSRLRTTIPRGTRLNALSISADGWIQVKQNGEEGYVDMGHLVGRADFAIWAWRKAHGWFLVSHREGAVLKSRDGQSIPLNEIQGYSPNPHHAIVTANEESTLPLRAHVELEKSEATVWGVSLLEGHGEVWWKKDLVVLQDSATAADSSLTTDELLKRQVFSYALTGGTAKMEGLVSAQGVWKTEDGLHWTKIQAFGDQDSPVAIRGKKWFVGSVQSLDKGKSFESFVRWEKLAKTIEEKLHRPARYVKLQKIEPVGDSQVELLIDTGVKRLSLRVNL